MTADELINEYLPLMKNAIRDCRTQHRDGYLADVMSELINVQTRTPLLLPDHIWEGVGFDPRSKRNATADSDRKKGNRK